MTGNSKKVLVTLAMAGCALAACGGGNSKSSPPQIAPSVGQVIVSTNFPAAENPLSEGSTWTNGKAVGLLWNNPRTTVGEAYASTPAGLGLSRYDDSIAHLRTSVAFTPNQFAQATVYKAAGYATSGSHEVELLLRFEITANSARGYEILWGIGGYVAIVRWNGPLGNYTPLYDPGPGSISIPVDGDVLRAEIVGNTITVFRNGKFVASASDSTYATGQPGMGFWPIDGATPENLGWKSYQAGNL